jgi:hypothetical protein
MGDVMKELTTRQRDAVILDKALKSITNAETRLGYIEAKKNTRAVQMQIESIKIDLLVARQAIKQVKGDDGE